MERKTFMFMTGGIFAIIAFLHLIRLLLGWGASIGGSPVPMWASVVALVLSGFFAYEGFRLTRES